MMILALMPASLQPGFSADRCMDASDYRGCMEYHSGGDKGSVDVQKPTDHNYRPN